MYDEGDAEDPGGVEDVSAAVAQAADAAWHVLLWARKAGPHETQRMAADALVPSMEGGDEPQANEAADIYKPQVFWREPLRVQTAIVGAWTNGVDAVREFFASASGLEWSFLLVVLAGLLLMDVFILQQLPETERTHASLLLFWLMVATTYGCQIWLRSGFVAGTAWITGYLMELVYSIDSVFVTLLICTTLEVPRRLLAKAMFVSLLGSIFFRLLLLCGLASTLYSLKLIPYVIGAVLVYCGTANITKISEESADVTQTTVVRSFKRLLGDRLCDFYDEDGEAMFLLSKGKVCMTLLGVVVFCILSADLLLGLDVVLAKVDAIPNSYLNFTSSIVALFTVRALFFVVRDVFCRFNLTRAGVGMVLLFVGVELLLARAVYVSAAVSFLIVFCLSASMVAVSTVQPNLQPWTKEEMMGTLI